MFDPAQPSPTSTLGINVRYYQVKNANGSAVIWDIGEDMEKMVEALYPGYTGPGGLPGFQACLQEIFTAMMDHVTALYPLIFVSTMYFREEGKELLELDHRNRTVLHARAIALIAKGLVQHSPPTVNKPQFKTFF